MSDAQYLFVTGCSRSGTSLMTDILRSHPAIAMGAERYANRYVERTLDPSFFTRDRFCVEWHSEDSHHRKMNPYYADLLDRFDSCAYRGDKIPEIALDYSTLLNNFEQPRIIYMMRNLLDVASSFKARVLAARRNPSPFGWPVDRDHVAAVDEWNQSVRNTLAAVGSRNRAAFILVRYEHIFDSDLPSRLCSALGLEVADEMRAFYREAHERSAEIAGSRRMLLTEEEARYVQSHVDTASWQALLELEKAQSAQAG